MACSAGPDIIESGLVLALDAADYNSFKGEVTTNLIPDPILGQQVVGSGGSGYSVSTDNTVINPFGNNGATKIVVNSSGSGYTRQGGTVNLTAGVTYTFSCFFKNGNVNLSNITNSTFGSVFGIVIQSFSPTYDALEGYFNLVSTTSYPNDWVRKSFTFTPNYTQTYYCSFSTTPNTETAGTYYLYGFQLEQKSYSSSFVAGTRGSTVATGGGWADLIGNGNHGELVNGVKESSDNLGALVFDGSDDYINCGSNSSLGLGALTLSVWVKASADVSNYRAIIADESPGGAPWNYRLYLRIGDGHVIFDVNGGGYSGVSSTYAINNNQWYHICAVRTAPGGTQNLYINGILDNSGSDGTTISTVANAVWIGQSPYNNGSYPFNGNIASVKIYNRALTASEIQQNFNMMRGRFGI